MTAAFPTDDGTVYDTTLTAVGFTAPTGAPPASALISPVEQVAEQRERAAELVRQLTGRVRDYSRNRPRSRQRRIGPSEVGTPCLRQLGYKVAGTEPVNGDGGDPWPSYVGTAVHAELERTFEGQHGWVTERRVTVDAELDLHGSTDLIRLTDGVTVIDHKVVGTPTMKRTRAQGPADYYVTQLNLYAHGWIAAGVPVEWVAIAYWPRSGRLSELYVWLAPYSQEIAERAMQRLANVRALVAAGGPAIVGQLPTAEHYCDGCDFYRPGSTDPATACPGAGH